jgi:hypothetical protein
LIIYVAPTRAVDVISLLYLIEALHQNQRSASALKSLLETGSAPKVFFDVLKTAKILFDNCAIRLANPVCLTHPFSKNVLIAVYSLALYELTFTKCR